MLRVSLLALALINILLIDDVVRVNAAPLPDSTPKPSSMIRLPSEHISLSVRQRRGGSSRRPISRSALNEIVQRGVPSLLAQVRVKPERRKDRFIGFRLTQILPQSIPHQAGFKIGDVIISVNGEPIGRPDQMMHALSVLPFAEQLTIRFERSGLAKEWTWPIHSP